MTGTLTQAQLLVEVKAALGNRVDLALTDFRLTNALNLSQQRVSRFFSFPELRNDWQATGIITGTPAIDKWLVLPQNVKVIHSFILQDSGNSRKLIEKPWRMFDYNVPLPEFIAPDWPNYYTRFDLNVAMLFPIPLNAFSYFIRATMLPTPFPNPTLQGYTGAMVSDYVDKDDILISLSAAYFLRQFGRHDVAQGWETEAMIRLKESIATSEDTPDMDFSPDDMGGGALVPSTGEYWLSPFITAVSG